MARYNNKYYGMPWILDTKYMYANGSMLKKAGVDTAELRPGTASSPRSSRSRPRGIVKYPWLGSWSQAEAVVCDYAQLLGAFGGQFLDASGKPAFQTGGGLTGTRVHEDAARREAGRPGVDQLARGGRAEGVRAGTIAMNLNWTFQLAGALDPPQSTVSKDDVMILHTPPGTGGKRRPGLQRRPAGDDHLGLQAPQRGVGVHQVHHQPADAERLRQGLAADLVGVLHRPGGRQGRRLAARRRWPRPSCRT